MAKLALINREAKRRATVKKFCSTRHQVWINGVRVSPDGRRVAFWNHPSRGDNLASLDVIEKDGTRRSLGPGASSAGLAWAPDGNGLWSGGFALSLSGQRRHGLQLYGGGYLHDVAPGGRALVGRRTFRREIVGRAPGRAAEANLSWLDWSHPEDISGDGRTMLFDEQNIFSDSGSYAIYLRGTDGSPAVRLGQGQSLALSPDGKWALARSLTAGAIDLVLLPTGAGEPRTLPRPGLDPEAGIFFPDGRKLLLKRKGLKLTLAIGDRQGEALLRRIDHGPDVQAIVRKALEQAAKAAGATVSVEAGAIHLEVEA